MTEPEPTAGRRVTIKEVAQAAGVGVVSVSRALNDQPGVSGETRERIREIARSLGYRPNRHARFLKLSSSRSIALMMKGIDNPFFQQMLETVENAARERDYLLSVIKVPHYADEVDEAIKLVDEDAVAGLIFLGGNFTHQPADLARLQVPFVLSTIGQLEGVDPASYSSVAVDDFAESRRATQHLLGLGHRRIALLGVGLRDTSVGMLRRRGYQAALSEAGLASDDGLVRGLDLDGRSPYNFEYGYQLTTRLLAERPDVTAIFAVADVIAIGALKAALDRGLRVPQDLSIVGFDGIPVGLYVHPTLTTLVQPARQIAELTCQILFDNMAGAPARQELLKGELRVGGTAGAPRTDEFAGTR